MLLLRLLLREGLLHPSIPWMASWEARRLAAKPGGNALLRLLLLPGRAKSLPVLRFLRAAPKALVANERWRSTASDGARSLLFVEWAYFHGLAPSPVESCHRVSCQRLANGLLVSLDTYPASMSMIEMHLSDDVAEKAAFSFIIRWPVWLH